MDGIEKLFELHHIEGANFIQEIMGFTICSLIIGSIAFLTVKKMKNSFYTEKHIFFKVFSSIMTLMRSFLQTYLILIIACNFQQFEANASTSIKYTQIFLISGMTIQLVLIAYFSSQFYNLNVPNQYLPWSETNNQPFILKFLFKIAICLAFNFRTIPTLKYTFLSLATVIIGYLIYVRIRRSYMFNKLIFNIHLYADSILFHMVAMIIPSELFQNQEYYIFIILTLPIWLLAIYYWNQYQRTDWVVDNLNDENLDKEERIFNFLNLLEFYMKHDKYSKTYLGQIQYQHYIGCAKFGKRIERKLIKEKAYKQQQKLQSNQTDKVIEKQQTLSSISMLFNQHEIDQDSQCLVQAKSFIKPLGVLEEIKELDEESNMNFQGDTFSKFSVSQKHNGFGTTKLSVAMPMPKRKESTNIQRKRSSLKIKTMKRKSKLFDLNDSKSLSSAIKDEQPTSISKENSQKLGGYDSTLSRMSTFISAKAKQIKNIGRHGSVIEQNYNPQESKQEEQANEFDNVNTIKRDKELRRLVQHFFKHHLITENTQNYKFHLLKAYFTNKIMKNQFLSHFLMYDLVSKKNKKSNLVERNQKLLHQKLFEDMMTTKNQNIEHIQKIDLEKVLDLNQLFANFENLLESISDDIYKYWQNLANNKDAMNIYEKGIQIASEINTLQQLHQDIELKQGEKKEIKLHVLMSAFYKYVVFKQNEYVVEMQKTQAVLQMRKIANEKYDSLNREKGLILAKIDLKKPMTIKFINKAACSLIHLERSKAVGIKINQLMPQLISEFHHKFIEKFMATGKNKLIDKKRLLMLKKDNGHIIPINAFLCLNQIDLSSMIFLIENAMDEIKPFPELDDGNSGQFGIILTDSSLRVLEISQSTYNVCKINYRLLDLYRTTYNKNPYLDDLFNNDYTHTDILTYLNTESSNDLEVSIKYQELLDLKEEMHRENAQDEEESKSPANVQNIQKHLSQEKEKRNVKSNTSLTSFGGMGTLSDKGIQQSMLHQATFQMRIETEYFLGKQLDMKIVYIRMTFFPMIQTFGMGMQTLVQSAFTSKVQEEMKSGKSLMVSENNTAHEIQQEMTQSYTAYAMDIPEDFMDLSSQTSTTSSVSMIQTKFDFTQASIEGRKLPSTLKFVLQIVLLILMLVLATSTVSLVLIQSNFTDAKQGIQMSQLSIARLNMISQTRLMMRVLINIGYYYNEPSNEVLPDRYDFYMDLLDDQIEKLRLYQVELDSRDSEVALEIGNVKLEYLTSSASFEQQYRSISQSVNIYINYVNDLLGTVRISGRAALNSSLVYFYIPIEDIRVASITERKMYFVIQNANQELYYQLNRFAERYIEIKSNRIQEKVDFSSTMTWICIGIIMLSGLLIIPLFSKIQGRIFNLMSLFFSIDSVIKNQYLDKITIFMKFIGTGDMQKKTDKRKLLHQLSMDESQAKLNQSRKNLSSNKLQSDQLSIILDMPSLEDNEERKSAETSPRKKKRYFPNQGDEKTSDKDEDKKKGRKRRKSRNDSDESDSQKSEDSDHHKSKSKRKNKNVKQEDNDIRICTISLAQDEMTKKFKQSISKKKLTQSFLIVILTCMFQSYFLGTYFMSSSSFTEMSDSVDVIFILYQRKACGESVIHAIEEGYQWNDTYLINRGKDEIMDFYTTKCFKLENDYQVKVRKQRPPFLSEAMGLIDKLEDTDFCNDIFHDGDGFQKLLVTPEKCRQFAGGITQNGQTNIYQTTYKICQQLQIEYQTAFDTGGYRGPDFIYPRMRKAGIYLDVIETILSKPQAMINQQVQESIENYFLKSETYFVVFYAAFLIITFTLALFFFCSKYQLYFIYLQINTLQNYLHDSREKCCCQINLYSQLILTVQMRCRDKRLVNFQLNIEQN
eukprot:403373661